MGRASIFSMIMGFNPRVAGGADEKSFQLLVCLLVALIACIPSQQNATHALFIIIGKVIWRGLISSDAAKGFAKSASRARQQALKSTLECLEVVRMKLSLSTSSFLICFFLCEATIS